MTRPLQFIPFKSRADKGWAEAWELYEKSFPYNERWSEEAYDRAFGDPNFEADGIWRGGEFIGILFHWGADGYRYVEHLAVSPALRGQNMGSAALSAFCRKVGRVILEICHRTVHNKICLQFLVACMAFPDMGNKRFHLFLRHISLHVWLY